MLKVGLTGSIAVGKTFVCEIFREQGCHVLDADQTARDVVLPGTKGLEQIVREFGNEILAPDGSLDRKRLGAIIFADENKRKRLNSIVHPLVIEAQDLWLKQRMEMDPEVIAIIDAALMIESGGYRRFDHLIVVWCEPAIQLKRLMLRDGLTPEQAKGRVDAQMPQEEKKRFADHLIDTTAGFDDTRKQTIQVFDRLRSLK